MENRKPAAGLSAWWSTSSAPEKTVAARIRTGRRCYGLEIDPLYVDTIIRRWHAYSGGRAVNAASGKSFTEHEVEAEKQVDAARTDR